MKMHCCQQLQQCEENNYGINDSVLYRKMRNATIFHIFPIFKEFLMSKLKFLEIGNCIYPDFPPTYLIKLQIHE